MTWLTKGALFVGVSLAAVSLQARDWYVDANNGNDLWDGSCPFADRDESLLKGPLKTLQKAMGIPALADDDTVHAAEGVYSEGECWDGYNTNRLYVTKAIRIVADGAKERTVIEGALSDAHTSGNGPGGVRCVYLNSTGASIRGFTIRKGRTDTCGDKAWQYAAGGVMGGTVIDCVITNCNASYRGAVGGVSRQNLIGCTIFAPNAKNARNERYTGYGNLFCYNSIIYVASSSSTFSQSPATGGIYVNCSFPDGGPNGGSAAYNCYFRYAAGPLGSNPAAPMYYCRYVSTRAGMNIQEGTKQIDESSLKTNSATFYPTLGSSLIDVGSTELYEQNFVADLKAEFGDFAHGMTARKLGRSIDIGAGEYNCAADFASVISGGSPYLTVANLPAAASLDGSVAVLPVGTDMTATWRIPSGTVTENAFDLSVSVTGSARLDIYRDDAASPSWTLTAADGVRDIRYFAGVHALRFVCTGADGEVRISKFVTDVKTAYFVRQDGKDDADGQSVDTAWQSLRRALLEPKLAAGDIIYVGPGIYADGQMGDGVNDGVGFCRVIVPAGVGLVGYAGASETILEGRFDSDDVPCGPRAIRTAYLQAESFIKGFTLRNGATWQIPDPAPSQKNPWNGGNAYLENGASLVDCVVSNGVAAYRGGGVGSLYAPGGNYVRCLIVSNRSLDETGMGGCNGSYFDCVLKGSGGTVYTTRGKVVNCTIVGSAHVRGNGSAEVYNSVIEKTDGGQARYHRCLLGCSSLGAGSSLDDGSLLNQGAAIGTLDAAYRPAANSAAVNFGDVNHARTNYPSAWVSDLDFAGGQRVYDGAIDAGAGEHDWRADYARLLDARGHLAGVSATPGVTHAANGVVLTAGETVVFDWRGQTGSQVVLMTTVEGAGTLAVRLNGSLLTPKADGTYAFTPGPSGSRIEASFAGAGSATLQSLRGFGGFILLVR